ncbi:YceI family protein [Stappia sp. ES.058]|uniref:YceI family protein n=1 Tax=Stappia sp. ES.058 TaxID=1881061 RepID=UPI00087CEF04|nr:YceI family protein [Stappia sp. ES.058]SDU05502.1 Polyisoprenoid-binding protein YceI [Stappia sp. ES.058]
MSRSSTLKRLALTIGLVTVAATPTAATTWSVDQGASSVTFVAQQNGSPLKGTFQDWSAEITLDPNALDEAEINATVRPGSAKTGKPQVDQTLPGAAWFATSSHPEATFTSSEIVSTGEISYEARGTLTIKGKSEPFVLPFTLTVDGDTARAKASVSLARLIFGVGTDVSPPTVADPVTVDLEITATR